MCRSTRAILRNASPSWHRTPGGRVVIADGDTVRDAFRLSAELKRQGATVLQATPTTWRMLLKAGWKGCPRLTIMSGGEAMSPDLARQLLARGAAVWNLYGPTE